MKQLSYCGQYVKENDPDRFLLSLFCHYSCREALWALLAFNCEISKTREVVSDSTLGHIRLQWWKDEIAHIYNNQTPKAHEVLKPLSKAIHHYSLPKEYFDNLLYAREFDLENVFPSDIKGLMNYADFTSSPLMKLALMISGGDYKEEPIKEIATNYALAGLLRAIPYHAKQARGFLPEDLLKAEGLAKEELFSFQKKEKLAQITKKIMSQRARKQKPHHIFLKASNILADIYFQHIKKQQYDVFSPKTQMDPAFKVLRLYMRSKFFR